MTETATVSQLRGIRERDIVLLLRISVFGSLLLSLHLALTQEINWDEFFYLSQIYSYLRGDLNLPLQTIHVHLWSWLPGIGTNEVEQIRLARVIVWGMQCGTVWALYRIAKTFLGETAALFSLLVYLSFDYVLVNGTSFRTDTTAVLLVLSSLALLLGPLDIRRMVLFCMLVALSAMITIKVALYAPAYVGIAAWRVHQAEERFSTLCRIIGMVIGTFGLFAAAYLLHRASLAGNTTAVAQSMLSSAAKTTVVETSLFPSRYYMFTALYHAPISVLLLLGGIPATVVMRNRLPRGGAFVILMLAMPLVSFAFYRNAYPYYYAFILPTASLLAGVVFMAIERSKLAQAVLILIVSATILRSWWALPDHRLQDQAETVEAIHQIFPEPVQYIDRSSTIASFPRKGFFMSTWGMSGYLRDGRPKFRAMMEVDAIPLLLLNSAHLVAAVDNEARQPTETLNDVDRAALSENFIPHWGAIWVAGKSLDLSESGALVEFLVPGEYTLEGDQAIEFDGVHHAPGSVIAIPRGQHEVRGTGTATLRWGNDLYRPVGQEPSAPFFSGFQPSLRGG